MTNTPPKLLISLAKYTLAKHLKILFDLPVTSPRLAIHSRVSHSQHATDPRILSYYANMTVEHLELPLHNLFEDRAVPLQDFELPDNLRPSWLTPRKLQLLSVQDEVKTVIHTFDLNKTFCDKIPGFPQLQEYDEKSLKRTLFRSAAAWRVANGVFASSKVKYPDGPRLKDTMAVAVELDDDQWFFGTIFTVDKQSWTMRPCVDRLASREEKATLNRLPVTTYPLPKPQDVDGSFRTALQARGRRLPDFEEWVNDNRQYFPAHIQDDTDFDFGRRTQQSRISQQHEISGSRRQETRRLNNSEDSYQSDEDHEDSADSGRIARKLPHAKR